jgi:hypothetical protein
MEILAAATAAKSIGCLCVASKAPTVSTLRHRESISGHLWALSALQHVFKQAPSLM